MTDFLTKVRAAYTLKERLQTLHKKKPPLKGVTSLVGYSTPNGEWFPVVKKAMEIVKSHNIPASLPVTKSGHISVCVISDLTESERDAIRNFAQKEKRPKFSATGLDLFPGGKNLDYLSIAYSIPNEHKRLFAFIRTLCGPDRISDFRTWSKDHKPHASLITTNADYRAKVKELIPEVWGKIKGDLPSFTPEYIEFFDKMELSEFHEIKGCYLATTCRSYIHK